MVVIHRNAIVNQCYSLYYMLIKWSGITYIVLVKTCLIMLTKGKSLYVKIATKRKLVMTSVMLFSSRIY